MPRIPRGAVALAMSQAAKSPMLHRHGAVIWKNGSILGAGYNFQHTTDLQLKSRRRFSIHGERDALAGLRGDQIRGASMLAIRIKPTGGLSFGAPCKGCTKLLRRKGVKVVYWYDELGNLSCTYLQHGTQE